MKIGFRFALLAAIVALMATSLGSVAAFVLLRNGESSRAVSGLQINQALTDIGGQIERFLRKGPLALNQMARMVEMRLLDLDDTDRLETYLISEMQADRDLTWLSYSSSDTGAFIGVTRRDEMLVLNRAALDVNEGRPREWQIRKQDDRLPLAPKLQVPYDPRTAPWFLLGLKAEQPRWTDLYKFAEGEWGISAVLRLRPPGVRDGGGVATADFHLRVLEEFLSHLRVGQRGRAVVIVPQATGDRVTLGGGSLPPVMTAALQDAVGRIPTNPSGSSVVPLEFRHGSDPVVTNIRTLDVGGGRPWFVTVIMPVDEVDGPIQRATRDTLVVSAIFLAVGVSIAVWISGAITHPIRSMSDDLRRVGELRLSSAPPVRSFIHELDTMGKTVAAMKAGLRSFSRYVPIELVRATLNSGRDVEPGGETRILTVLFTDIEDFTSIAEALPPEQLTRDLGSYFDALEKVITEAGGLVDKFMGDGAMALFNAPIILPDHAARACKAALKLQEALDTFNLEREAKGLTPFRTRIGLALGPAMVGNIGTSRRLSYTAIGSVVNLACRLEDLNKVYGTTILADGSVRAEAGDGFEWHHLDCIEVAGRAAKVELYELSGLRKRAGLQQARGG